MPGREYSAGSGYRYGFNGKENDKDAGEGIQDYGMRIYDARLGRFLSVDPITKDYPWYTPYQFAGNKPIIAVDLDGEEELIRINYYDQEGKNSVAVFIPLSTHESEKIFNDIWADINGVSTSRNWKSGKIDRFNPTTTAPIARNEIDDYASGNIFKNGQNFKAPYTGQLTIDVNKPGSDFKFNLSYKRELTKDDLYDKYKSESIKTNLLETGYLTADGLSGIGNFFTRVGTVASLTLGPEVGGWALAGGTILSSAGDGLELLLDFTRVDKSAATEKAFIFGTSRFFDVILGKAGKLDPSQKQKVDAVGGVLNEGTGAIKNEIKSDSADLPRPRKKDIISNSLNYLKKM